MRAARLLRFVGGAILGRLGAVVLLAALCVIRIWDPAPVQFARVKNFDLYQNLRPARIAEQQVVIVDIDDDSLNKLGQWPWPRTLLARLTERLLESQVAAIGFDIVFPEPDRHSPKRYAESMPELPQVVRDTLQGLPSNDEKFAAALARGPTVLGIAFRRGERGDLGREPVASPPISVRAPLDVDARRYLVGTSALLANVGVLQKAAKSGMITPYPEFDGVVRRVPAIYRVGDALYTALAIEMIRVAIGGRTLVMRAGREGIENIVFAGVDMPSIAVPTDRRGRLWVHFSHHDPKRYVPAHAVLDGSVKRERLQGKLILVGTSAVGLLDMRATPLTGNMPGVEIHAQLIDNILSQRHITRPYFADAVEFFATIVLSLLLIFVLPLLGAARTLASGFALAAVVSGGAWYLFANNGQLFDLTFPLGCSFAIFAVVTFFNYMREEQQKKWVRGAFSRYLSPTVVDELARHPDQLNLGGQLRPMTLLFSDIRGFTGISERFDAAGLTAFMNRYLTPMTECIMQRGGTVDKYIGDAIMAFWNAPLDDPQHAANACHAALDMIERLKALNAQLAAEAQQAGTAPIKIAIGVGLNSAQCCVGNMGSQQRFDYSVLGDGVNLASRLEGQTKAYTVPILIGEDTFALAPDFAALEIDLIRVKGKSAPARVFALMGRPERAQSAEFRALVEAQAKFLAAYRARDWDAALRALDAVRAAGGDAMGGLVYVYRARIDEYRRDPPPPGWDGVHAAETK